MILCCNISASLIEITYYLFFWHIYTEWNK